MLIKVVFVSLCFFSANEFRAEGALSMTSIAKARRTQSMKPLTSHRTGNILATHAQSGSELSSVSSSISELRTAEESKPIASTSTGTRTASTGFSEVVQ